MDPTVRPAREGDVPDIRAFARDSWPDRDAEDYVPEVIDDWIAADGDERRTLVADADGTAVGLVGTVLLSEYETWLQGMRVDPDHRGAGIGTRLTHAAFDWARGRGATVARNMVFSWNLPGLGLSRAAGFEPAAAFRWAHPEPDPDAEPDAAITAEPAAAWSYWETSDARAALAGLALDPAEPWAVSSLARDRLARAADEGALLVVQDGGTRGFANRVRTDERGGERWIEYGVGAWAGLDAARALFAAIAADAASIGADRTRVLVPETPRAVSDAAAAGVPLDAEPDFVLAADLTAR